jgi:hypothetical protein
MTADAGNAVTADSISLGQIAAARSGDKGNHANIGIVAFRQAGYDFLCQALTPGKMASHFADLGATRIERYELPNLWALNFVLFNALAGGASGSLKIDTQGKLLGTRAEQIRFPAPENLAELLLDEPSP